MSSVHSVTHVLGSYRSRASSPGETPAGDDCQIVFFVFYRLLRLLVLFGWNVQLLANLEAVGVGDVVGGDDFPDADVVVGGDVF